MAKGEPQVDVRPGYGPETLYRLLDAYGVTGRRFFRTMLYLDMIFPAIYPILGKPPALLLELGVETLELLGYEVLSVGDGVEAVDMFRTCHAQLSAVLLDLKMPRMGGKEAYPLIKGINPRVPVIICTGFGENEEVQELLTLGAACLMAKPYRIADLATRLQQIISI
jgi:CheY-like chemotaxis protein